MTFTFHRKGRAQLRPCPELREWHHVVQTGLCHSVAGCVGSLASPDSWSCLGDQMTGAAMATEE